MYALPLSLSKLSSVSPFVALYFPAACWDICVPVFQGGHPTTWSTNIALTCIWQPAETTALSCREQTIIRTHLQYMWAHWVWVSFQAGSSTDLAAGVPGYPTDPDSSFLSESSWPVSFALLGHCPSAIYCVLLCICGIKKEMRTEHKHINSWSEFSARRRIFSSVLGDQCHILDGLTPVVRIH